MRIKTNGGKLDTQFVAIKNAEASASIPNGTPVMLAVNATDDGLAVVLPSGAALRAHAFAFGVYSGNSSLIAGDVGYAQVFGFCRKAVVLLQTRSDNSASYSASTHSSGCLLNIDTVNNAFSTSGGTLAKTSYLPFAVLAESTAVAASASTTADTSTVVTGYMKVFLRML